MEDWAEKEGLTQVVRVPSNGCMGRTVWGALGVGTSVEAGKVGGLSRGGTALGSPCSPQALPAFIADVTYGAGQGLAGVGDGTGAGPPHRSLGQLIALLRGHSGLSQAPVSLPVKRGMNPPETGQEDPGTAGR